MGKRRGPQFLVDAEHGSKATSGTFKIRRWRKRLGLYQSEAAALLKIDQGHFSKIERGDMCPGATLREVIANVAGIQASAWHSAVDLDKLSETGPGRTGKDAA